MNKQYHSPCLCIVVVVITVVVGSRDLLFNLVEVLPRAHGGGRGAGSKMADVVVERLKVELKFI